MTTKKNKKIKREIVSIKKINKAKRKTSLSPELVPTVSEGGSALQNYMLKISKIPLLTREEEYQLATEYFETRDTGIAKQLIQANLRFVVKVVSEYSKFSSKVMDLIQEGNTGLIRAVQEFNPYKGARLITYAVWWIRGYIQEYLMRHHSIVRIGTNKKQQKLFYLLTKEKKKLEEYSEKYFLPALAKEAGTRLFEVEKMKEFIVKKDLSLNQFIQGERGKTFLDIQPDKSSSLYEQLSLNQMGDLLKKELKKMDKDFTEKEKVIIEKRFLKDPPQTLQEIADGFQVTREAIRQNEERLMEKLRKRLVPILKKPY